MEEPELRILSSFFPETNRIRTTKDIENSSGYSHERVHTILATLEKKGGVIKRKLGKVNVYRLNVSPATLLPYLCYMEKEKKAFFGGNMAFAEKLAGLLPEIEDLCDALILRRQKDRHKIEFLCLLRGDETRAKEKITSVLGKNVEFVKAAEFGNSRKTFREDAVNGIVLAGIEIFHRVAYLRGNENAEEI